MALPLSARSLARLTGRGNADQLQAEGESNEPEIDTAGLLEFWTDRVERLLRACVRDRPIWPEAQSVDVPFDAFIADDMAVVREVRAQPGSTVRAGQCLVVIEAG